MARRPVALAAYLLLLLPATAFATNGDTLLGVGPTSRSMGGVGVAAPLDAIGAIFSNPAAMCSDSYCAGSQAIFATTVYDTRVTARIGGPGGTTNAKSSEDPFLIPAVGITAPLSPRVRFGFGAYGISGMGVDYRDSRIDLDGNTGNGYEGDIFTQLQVMKFSPNLAFRVTDNFSVGAALDIVYGSLDLGRGASHNYTVGAQLGAIYHDGPLSAGVRYTTPEKVRHERVNDFDGDGRRDMLELEAPQTMAAGTALRSGNFLIEGDVRWLNWADAAGYRDFGWKNQWIFAVGGQYAIPGGITFRAGYNYGASPVRTHNGFSPSGTVRVQGKNVPTYGYEYLRIVGFPAVAEHHITAGISAHLTPVIDAYLGATYAPPSTVTERDSSKTLLLSSTVEEKTLEFGLSWNFF